MYRFLLPWRSFDYKQVHKRNVKKVDNGFLEKCGKNIVISLLLVTDKTSGSSAPRLSAVGGGGGGVGFGLCSLATFHLYVVLAHPVVYELVRIT